MPIREYTLAKVLQGLGINFEEVRRTIASDLNRLSIEFFSLRICVFCLDVIIVIRSKVLDKNVHLISSNNIEISKLFLNISTKKYYLYSRCLFSFVFLLQIEIWRT